MAGRRRSAEVHAIVGDAKAGFDSYRAEEALEAILEESLGAARGDAVQVFRGDETTWGRILDSARTSSLFSERRAVVVRSAEAIKGDPEDLGAYLDDPNPDVTLIFLAAKPDGRKAAWKRLTEKAKVTKVEPLKGRSLRAYVAQELRRRDLVLGEEGQGELLERVGQDLRRLMGEIEKLAAFADGKEPLTAETVSAVLGRGLAPPLYRVGDALSARRSAEVIALADSLMDEGESAILILGALFRALRQVRGARALGASRGRRQDLAARLRIPPFKVDDVLASARLWPEKDLRRAMTAFGRADRLLKTGGEPRVVLSAAVVEACRAS
ncbi:MAG: DNA polymerase III subunit delta [Vicinamibacteria bacterium]